MKKKSTFKYASQLPSVYVQKSLLENLEDYFLYNIPTLLNQSNEFIKNQYSIVIRYSNSEEKLNSIREYILNTFPDDTSEIGISLMYWQEYGFVSINVNLGEDKLSATIKVEITNENPKETAQGIVSSLQQIIKQNRNNNNIYHPSNLLESILGFIAFVSAMISVNVFKYSIQYSALFLSFSVILFSYLSLLPKWKPFISFDSNKQRKYDRISNWFFYGLLSFLIFGNLFVVFQNFFSDR